MRRLIVAEANWTWRWGLRYYPKPGDKFEVSDSNIEETPTLVEILSRVEGVEDVRIRMTRRVLPDKIEFLAPGDSKPTSFHLTGEPRESYTIGDSFNLVICDTPVLFNHEHSCPVIEAGWQSNADTGIRIVTPGDARRKFEVAPEAFSAGEQFCATSEMPVLYVLGGGGAVWLTGIERGVFWQNEAFSDQCKTIALVTDIVTNAILAKNDDSPRSAMERWQEHQNILPT